MTTEKGYYSLIQFCPDVSRLEAVNLGVILFCPSSGFLRALTSRSTQRAEKLVGRGELARVALKTAKTAIEKRLLVDRESFHSLEDLQRFVDTRGNSLQLTPPRPLKVTSPDDELKRLFKELVGGKTVTDAEATKPPAFPSLQNLFTRLSSEGRAKLNYETTLPVLGQEFTVPYAYQNGVLNLVKPHQFKRNSAKAALDLAIRGDLIKKHGIDDRQESRLVVISRFAPKCDPEFVHHVDQLFSEYSVRHVPAAAVEEFANQVEVEAHA
jgi:hypothetical protein